MCFFFFFKQKTAYEMRISDWSSDVCSSDLQVVIEPIPPEEFIKTGRSRYLDKADYLAHRYRCTLGDLVDDGYDPALVYSTTGSDDDLAKIGRASCRERVCQYV